MKKRELYNLGIPKGEAANVAMEVVRAASKAGEKKNDIRGAIAALIADPSTYLEDEIYGALASCVSERLSAQESFVPRDEPRMRSPIGSASRSGWTARETGMRIDATYRVVTPCFCTGADPTCAELRLPSFKGALRFWWRALAWQRRGGDLQAIQQEEDALFGSAGRGQSRLIMRLASTSHSQSIIRVGEVLTVSGKNTSVVDEGARYLGSRYLGYGVMEAFPRPRKGIKAGSSHAPVYVHHSILLSKSGAAALMRNNKPR